MEMFNKYRSFVVMIGFSASLWVFEAILFESSYEIQKEQVLGNLYAVEKTTENAIYLWEKERIRSAIKWADSPVLSRYFSKSTPGNYKQPQSMRDWLDGVSSLSSFDGAILVDHKINILAKSGLSIPELDFKSLLSDENRTGLGLGNTIFSKPILLAQAKMAYLPIWTPIYDEDANVLGFMILLNNVDALESILTIGQIGRTGDTYLVSQENLMLTKSRYSEAIDTEFVEVNTEATYINKTAKDLFLDADGYTDYRNVNVVGISRKFKSLNVVIVTEQDYEEAYEIVENQRNVNLFFIMLSCIVLLLMAWYQDKNRAESDFERRRFRSLFFDTDKVYLILNLKGRMLDRNREFEQEFLSHGKLEKEYIYDVLSKNSRKTIDKYIQLTISQGNFEFEYKTDLNNYYKIVLRYIEFNEDEKKQNFILFEGEDITEQSRLQAKISENEERLRVTLSATQQGLFEMNYITKSEYFDPSILSMLGYDGEREISRSRLDSLCYSKDLSKLAKHYLNLQLSKTNDEFYAEARFKAADGGWRILGISAKIIARLPDGSPGRVVGIHTDITKKKELEIKLVKQQRELKEFNKQLKLAAKTKDEFLATMSHELRTPLNAVLALSEVLMEKTVGDLNEDQYKYLSNIYDSGKHLLDLINDVLDISKIQAGKMELDLSSVNLDEVINASLMLVKQQANNKHQFIEYIPPKSSIVLKADPRRLKQILVNLLSNAVKFTPEKGQLGIHIIPDAQNRKLELIVWDRGIGISEEQQKKLFQPFSQADSRLARTAEGTGLGLSLVKSMVELHKGSISLDSEPGKGSQFVVNIPWDGVKSAEVVPFDYGMKSVSEEVHGSKHISDGTIEDYEISDPTRADESLDFYIGEDENPKEDCTSNEFSLVDDDQIVNTKDKDQQLSSERFQILLVEDNLKNQELMRDYLVNKGAEVILGRNGQEAVEYWQSMKPDLVLMDIQMPVMNGLDAIKLIRQEERTSNLKRTPIFVVSALSMANDKEQCMKYGADGYFSKPVVLKDIWLEIDKFIVAKIKSA